MSAVTVPKSRPGKTRGSVAKTVASLPQVNLLPPEVRASRSLSRTKRWLGLTILLALVVVAAGYGYALLQRASANSELASAQQQASALQVEANKYAEVPQVLGQVSQVTAARSTAMADDVEWRAYLDAIAAVLPAGVSIDSMSITGPDSLHAATAATTDAFGTSGIGTIAFSARSTTIPDTAAWLDALATVPGLLAPQASSVAAAATDDGVTYYTVAVTASLDSDVLSHRFDETAGN